ncbi:glycosyltransferase family 2 protein [Thermorudis peleae]|uniref:glycosyltransferase family 2 protein n=1 Tax=Thermorudis peleae TaxID=1382356 RepID=UPI00068A8248|nr:glycosyltransferase family A protein [Thermorudis peleae]
MALVDVLIPTYRRKTGLALVLASLVNQTFQDFTVTVSSQTEAEDDYLESPEIRTLVQLLRLRGHTVRLLRHWPRHGMAEHRQFLLEQSQAPYVHFLDDDVVLEPEVMERMLQVIQREECGFVGCAAIGLEFINDVRPHELAWFEPWDGPVQPERWTPETIPWERHKVNNAANALHLAQRYCRDGQVIRYKVAWVGGANVLYDRAKLLEVGGFSWWPLLPVEHAGEEVLAQFLLIQRYGGCGILPSGTYHLGMPTTILNREHNATDLFAQLITQLDHTADNEQKG